MVEREQALKFVENRDGTAERASESLSSWSARGDLIPLEKASLDFQHEASKGLVLLCRDPDLLASWKEHAWPRFLDLKPRFLEQTRGLLRGPQKPRP